MPTISGGIPRGRDPGRSKERTMKARWLAIVMVSLAPAMTGSTMASGARGPAGAQGCATPSFAPHTDYAVGNTPATVAVGEFNGDGWQDLAAANRDSDNVSVLLGNGDGAFQPAVNFG